MPRDVSMACARHNSCNHFNFISMWALFWLNSQELQLSEWSYVSFLYSWVRLVSVALSVLCFLLCLSEWCVPISLCCHGNKLTCQCHFSFGLGSHKNKHKNTSLRFNKMNYQKRNKNSLMEGVLLLSEFPRARVTGFPATVLFLRSDTALLSSFQVW